MYPLALTALNAGSVMFALFALSTAAAHYLKLSDWKALAAGMVGLGVAGYAYFWVMFFDTGIAPWVQMIFFGACIILALFAVLRRSASDMALIVPCLGVFAGAVGLMGWSVLLAGPDDSVANIFWFAGSRWTSPLPGDNEIPFHFGLQLREAQITSPMYVDWLSSDRPPLQTGMYLLLNLGRESREAYQGSSTALQMLSMGGIWVLARAMGTSRLWSILSMTALWFTPLVFVNGLFVWPKLLAAAFVAIAAAIHFATPRKERRSVVDGLIAGGAAALAMLSHGATAFALVGFAAAALVTLRLFSWRYIAAAVAAVVVLYAPWQAYQNLYDPPGNRLMKWHVAGAEAIDDRSMTEALVDSYSKLTPATWAKGRMDNIDRIMNPQLWAVQDFAAGRLNATKFRDQMFYSVPLGIGLFALALWGLPGFAISGATRALSIATIGALLGWAVLLFGGGQAVTHQGSYFPQLAVIAMTARLFSGNAILSKIGFVLFGAHVLLIGFIHALA